MTKSTPPPSLYKYLPNRDDFFDNPCIRYTPLKELNDPFESQLSIYTNTSESFFAPYADSLQSNLYNILNAVLDNGILSLSANHKNLLMWAHYTNNHCGLVLELDSTSDFFKHIDKVIYSHDRLNFNKINKSREENSSLLYKNTLYKSIHWSYEEEWRDFRIWVSNIPSIKPHIVGLVALPIDIIKNIYLGMRASNSFIQSAKNFCLKNANIGLYQAKLHPTQYELSFIQLYS